VALVASALAHLGVASTVSIPQPRLASEPEVALAVDLVAPESPLTPSPKVVESRPPDRQPALARATAPRRTSPAASQSEPAPVVSPPLENARAEPVSVEEIRVAAASSVSRNDAASIAGGIAFELSDGRPEPHGRSDDRPAAGRSSPGSAPGQSAASSEIVAAVPPSSSGAGEAVTSPRGGYQYRPSYPASARRLGVQGTTLLGVLVGADGRVAEVVVRHSAGHPDLDRAAIDAVQRWRFEPARRGSAPVPMWVLLPVEFRLQ
jgi:protein TonB